jgi:hypothetical protein
MKTVKAPPAAKTRKKKQTPVEKVTAAYRQRHYGAPYLGFREGFRYGALEDESTLPDFVVKQLELVKSLTPIKGIMLGDEIKEDVPEAVNWKAIGAAALTVAVVGGLVFFISSVMAASAVAVAVDPVVVVILDDEDETILEVARWRK